MTRLDAASEILALAAELGVGAAAPVDGILAYCRRRIDGWLAEAGGVTGIDALESLVTQRLQMVFEEIRSDEDFDRLTEVYARGKKEFVFAGMRSKFDDDDNLTYGALLGPTWRKSSDEPRPLGSGARQRSLTVAARLKMAFAMLDTVVQRRNGEADSRDRFVAVIDCRGSKLARRFFTRWHEIAHRLTTHADMPEPVYRSEHDPIERMMDEIAGHVGFYGLFFEPVFREARAGKTLLTFDTVKAVLDSGFPEASFQATLNACAKRLPTPVVYLEAALGHKAVVKREIEDDSPRLFAFEEPTPELRAVRAVANEAAQAEKFVIPQNMRVPESSVIRSLFDDDGKRDAASREDMGIWSDSKGKKLEGRAVAVEARKVFDRVIAIVQPVEPLRPKPRRPKAKGLFDE